MWFFVIIGILDIILFAVSISTHSPVAFAFMGLSVSATVIGIIVAIVYYKETRGTKENVYTRNTQEYIVDAEALHKMGRLSNTLLLETRIREILQCLIEYADESIYRVDFEPLSKIASLYADIKDIIGCANKRQKDALQSAQLSYAQALICPPAYTLTGGLRLIPDEVFLFADIASLTTTQASTKKRMEDALHCLERYFATDDTVNLENALPILGEIAQSKESFDDLEMARWYLLVNKNSQAFEREIKRELHSDEE